MTFVSTLKPYRLQQLEDRQLATKRYQSRSKEVNFWLDNMETKLGMLDLTVQEAKAVDLQIQQLRVSVIQSTPQFPSVNTAILFLS